MTIYVIFIITLLVCFFIIYITAHLCRKLQAENNQIKQELEQQKATIVEMYKYADELAMIKKDKSEVNKQINEAKTDEEIANIIGGIIAANNERLRK